MAGVRSFHSVVSVPAVRATICALVLSIAGACDQKSSTSPESRDATTPGVAASLPASNPAKGPVTLLHDNDLDNWTFDLKDPQAKMADVWSLKDGVLSCKGNPTGVLRTRDEYENYVLEVDWRWPEGTPGGNNGVLVHCSTPRVLDIWPRSIEVQLQKGEAGDFWIIGTTLHVPDEAKRKQGRRHLNLTDNSEKPHGEWNHFEITCRGNEILVKVNGELVNHATDVSETRGAICLQSEGAPIQYRNVRLTPLGD